MIYRRTRFSLLKLALVLIITMALPSCSALQPTDAGGPRANEPPYPLVLAEDSARRNAALLTWQHLAQPVTSTAKEGPSLQPYTATIAALPPNSSLFLPKVGTGSTMTEEERRESLRRFIREWQALIGADPDELSLVDWTDQTDGSTLARYEQHPFRYPLRGDYGWLQIRFRPDRSVTAFSSTCIPNASRLQATLGTINPQITWEDAARQVAQQSVTYPAGKENSASYKLGPTNQPTVRELVIYARNPAKETTALELHLAWEIEVSNTPFKLVYLDAVNGEIVGAA